MFNGTLWDFFWTMAIIFFWIIAIMIWFQVFTDLFRRDDITGGMKAVWIIALIIVPWLTALIYIITRPKVTASDVQNIVRMAAMAVLDAQSRDGNPRMPELRQRITS